MIIDVCCGYSCAGASISHHPNTTGAALPSYSEVKREREKLRSLRGDDDSGEGDGGSGTAERKRERKRKRKSVKRSSLHGELLEFISQEWGSLDMAEVN